MNSTNQIRVAAIIMFVSIGLGAMGAHLLKVKLTEHGHLDEWKTAALYQMIHGLAMFAVAAIGRRERPAFCFWVWLVGIVLFSGSLYVYSLTGSKALPIVLSTPLGGVAFMIGWAAIAINPRSIFGTKD